MRVETTLQAERALDNILSCSTDIYGKETIKKFYSNLKLYRHLLANNPLMGIEERDFSNAIFTYRSVVIHPLFKVIYTIKDNVLYIADIWDTRRDPELLRKRLE